MASPPLEWRLLVFIGSLLPNVHAGRSISARGRLESARLIPWRYNRLQLTPPQLGRGGHLLMPAMNGLALRARRDFRSGSGSFFWLIGRSIFNTFRTIKRAVGMVL